MTYFLLEILSEEIPALMQQEAADKLAKIAAEILVKNAVEIDQNKIKPLISPRRLALIIEGLKLSQILPSITKIGPRIDAKPEAIAGFLKSVKVSNKEDLEIVEHNGFSCYSYTSQVKEIATKDLIAASIEAILSKMVASWPKLMRWDIIGSDGNLKQAKWIRPIRNILCLFGNEVIEFEFAGQKSSNHTYGHFLYSNQQIRIDDASYYQEILRRNLVIVDQKERKSLIIKQISEIIRPLELITVDNLESGLIDEVCGLCENPTALVGNIDKKFLELPAEILILTMKLNQKYFCLKSAKTGQLSSKFIFISNAVINQDNEHKIIADNQKVLAARLSDAEFFISEDLKTPLILRTNELKNIIFHQQLGSIYDKIKRLEVVAKLIASSFNEVDQSLIIRALYLAKSDLATKAVGEFPELQGKIGSYYALKQCENQQVATAIAEIYLPTGPNSNLPTTAIGTILSLADRIDNIVGLFLIGQKPTSSKDPYALRRAALGIIRIVASNKLNFPIKTIIEKSLNLYQTKLVKQYLGTSNLKQQKTTLITEILTFIIERLRSYLKEAESIRPDIVNAVIDGHLQLKITKDQDCDILKIINKAKFLDDFIKNPNNQIIIELYKRSANIVTIGEKEENQVYSARKIPTKLKNHYEKSLHQSIKKIKPNYQKLLSNSDYDQAMELVLTLKQPISDFFDNLQVNDRDPAIKSNRLILLAEIRDLFNQIVDFSKIEIG